MKDNIKDGRVKVSIVKCDSYSKNILASSIEKCIGLLGGFEKFVKRGKKIVIKPNLLLASSPDDAVTTHPVFIECIVEKVKKAAENVDSIIIADSPGAGIPYNVSNLKKVYSKTGLLDVSKKTGCKLNYDIDYESLFFKEGLLIKKIDIIKPILDADIIINIPKFKTHNLTVITGAVKNMFGIVPGFLKPGYHMRFNEVEKFSGMLIDIVNFIKPTLNIMDGVYGIEGDGPGMSGSPRKIGFILASDDPVSLDAVMAMSVGIKEEFCPMIAAARKRNIKNAELSNINIVGEKIEDIIISDFKLPKSVGRDRLVKNNFFNTYILPFIKNSLNPYPALSPGKCNLCRICIEVCPENSIYEKNDIINFNYNKCIRCFCCSEICNQGAIEPKYSFLGDLIFSKLGWAGKRK